MNSLPRAALVSRAERKEKLAPKREGFFVMTGPYCLKACKCVQEQAFHRRSRGRHLEGTEKGNAPDYMSPVSSISNYYICAYFLIAEKPHVSVSRMENKLWKFQNVKNVFPDAFPEKCKNFLTVERRTIQRRGEENHSTRKIVEGG